MAKPPVAEEIVWINEKGVRFWGAIGVTFAGEKGLTGGEWRIPTAEQNFCQGSKSENRKKQWIKED